VNYSNINELAFDHRDARDAEPERNAERIGYINPNQFVPDEVFEQQKKSPAMTPAVPMTTMPDDDRWLSKAKSAGRDDGQPRSHAAAASRIWPIVDWPRRKL
jgi:hypothetical protein